MTRRSFVPLVTIATLAMTLVQVEAFPTFFPSHSELEGKDSLLSRIMVTRPYRMYRCAYPNANSRDSYSAMRGLSFRLYTEMREIGLYLEDFALFETEPSLYSDEVIKEEELFVH